MRNTFSKRLVEIRTLLSSHSDVISKFHNIHNKFHNKFVNIRAKVSRILSQNGTGDKFI